MYKNKFIIAVVVAVILGLTSLVLFAIAWSSTMDNMECDSNLSTEVSNKLELEEEISEKEKNFENYQEFVQFSNWFGDVEHYQYSRFWDDDEHKNEYVKFHTEDLPDTWELLDRGTIVMSYQSNDYNELECDAETLMYCLEGETFYMSMGYVSGYPVSKFARYDSEESYVMHTTDRGYEVRTIDAGAQVGQTYIYHISADNFENSVVILWSNYNNTHVYEDESQMNEQLESFYDVVELVEFTDESPY